ncbi:hypothetical protein ACFQBQ_01680 [Granulicella cerasi]|uniref:Uncharacterized protein n=1 Tax=Granulicella cerasi TaxID=741063 RepID=A0ABW1Z6N2_9BACT|nr:hypothetical protein [Granulicella cerasi]
MPTRFQISLLGLILAPTVAAITAQTPQPAAQIEIQLRDGRSGKSLPKTRLTVTEASSASAISSLDTAETSRAQDLDVILTTDESGNAKLTLAANMTALQIRVSGQVSCGSQIQIFPVATILSTGVTDANTCNPLPLWTPTHPGQLTFYVRPNAAEKFSW